MKERYLIGKKFRPKAIELIEICDGIVKEYVAKGMRLTVRQIYYQLVSRYPDRIENTVQSYNNIQVLLNDARLAGLIDWDAIEDRTRGLSEGAHWPNGKAILDVCAKGYYQDMWANQDHRIFVIIEKEALSGVFEGPCREYDCPLLAARGYPSASTLRELAKGRIMPASQQVVVLHFGDHDPSGLDMSRDLEERLQMFSRNRVPIDFRRIALNIDQIRELKLPSNPAKTTDCRFEKYAEQFGDESWELDALKPDYVQKLLVDTVSQFIDTDAWESTEEEIHRVRAKLKVLADNFDKEIE